MNHRTFQRFLRKNMSQKKIPLTSYVPQIHKKFHKKYFFPSFRANQALVTFMVFPLFQA